ncbi:GntR family transcriptional regulator [Romboutsia sp. Marseille-P6047]|uniref:GntR family transcriptional regulator n=1 Tax=Romboutsia sp. Marseille-P6047 TaxID=2161817 RepID=UPI000F051824|nr:GntR family transcriptional regulator [Romboutsia sp. Marseille-P6047]
MLKYQQVANDIENYIYDNDLSQGTKLPTVETLASDYSVSKSTIVKALELLVTKGMVYQVQGSGIFVRRKNRKGYVNFSTIPGFTNNFKGSKVTSKVLEFDLINATKEIADLLECNEYDEVYMVKRLRYLDDVIFCIEEAYYKKSIVPYLTKDIVECSIYEYLEKSLNLNFAFSDIYMIIEKLDSESASLLGLNSGDPALIVDEQVYLTSGVLFNASKVTYHYENSKFFFQS